MNYQCKQLNAILGLALSAAMIGKSIASPPQPAIDSCLDLSAGDSCNFVTPGGTENGFCSMPGPELVCDPNASADDITNPTADDPVMSADIGSVIGNTGSLLPDTGQTYCYEASGSQLPCPDSGASSYGQDAQYQSHAMSFTNNGDGTVSDNVTGLMWQQTTDTNGDGSINSSDKLGYDDAITYCDTLALADHSDWWLPDIKQLYSLIHFDGEDVSSFSGTDTTGLIPFIDTNYFAFGYGDTGAGERIIDSQYVSATKYVSTTMNGDDTVFGVNFADGRIKGYPVVMENTVKTFYVSCVRGNSGYGQNNFGYNHTGLNNDSDTGDSTITDHATGLMWAQSDNGKGTTWNDALAWVEQVNAASYLGYSDWRLPDIKELQSLVDYTRSPSSTGSAAINSLFSATPVTNEAGTTDYPYYWSSTTHVSSGQLPGANAAYISFGRAIGSLDSGSTWLDVHGAGAQRSDPKTGDENDYPQSNGPQGDALRVFNYSRLVRTDSYAQCAVFDVNASPQLSLPCVNVAGTLYRVDLNVDADSGSLHFEVDINTLAEVGGVAGSNCAVFPHGSQSQLRVNCVDVEGSKLWAELDWNADASGFQFDLADFGEF